MCDIETKIKSVAVINKKMNARPRKTYNRLMFESMKNNAENKGKRRKKTHKKNKKFSLSSGEVNNILLGNYTEEYFV